MKSIGEAFLRPDALPDVNHMRVQRDKIIQKARKMANKTYSVIERSYNKLLIGKTSWKSIVLLSVMLPI